MYHGRLQVLGLARGGFRQGRVCLIGRMPMVILVKMGRLPAAIKTVRTKTQVALPDVLRWPTTPIVVRGSANEVRSLNDGTIDDSVVNLQGGAILGLLLDALCPADIVAPAHNGRT
jgi:hypothetical protein